MIICKDQKEVNALDEFFEDGDVVEYESCSMFIDTGYINCSICFYLRINTNQNLNFVLQ